ncbi:methyltransferase [Balneatrix alpica]|uniref:methyltransferase n=1 Tax=Balneatrix alpica TaxID=75684 RepID=UPI0027389420|nr:methyltransferase [Balneatrix alpica]
MQASAAWQPSTQVVWRNLDVLSQAQPLLVINPPELAGWVELNKSVPCLFFSQDYRVSQAFRQQGLEIEFAVLPSPEQWQMAGAVLLFWPKAKELAQWLLGLLTSLPRELPIWVVGEHQAGVKSTPKLVEALGGSCYKQDNARRCSLFQLELPVAQPFSLEDYWRLDAWQLADQSLQVARLPGVFSEQSLDKGSQLLLDHLFLPQQGRVLDFGCGAGVLGAYLKTKCPSAEVVMLDVSALALEASKRTLAANQLDATVLASDAWSGVEGRFDFILSNPPFHTGIHTDYAPALALISQAKAHLNPGGVLQLVANSHLPYLEWLRQHFSKVQVDAETSQFRIYRAWR